jgi:hypothetical protein
MNAELFIVIAVVVGTIIALIVQFRKKGGDDDLSPWMDDGFDGE